MLRGTGLVLLGLLVLVLILSGWAIYAQLQIRQLQRTLDIFDTTVTLHYQYEHTVYSKANNENESKHNLSLTIPFRDYLYYTGKPRPDGFDEYKSMMSNPYVSLESYNYFAEYSAMAADPYDDAVIDSIIRQINETAIANNVIDYEKKASFAISFVQSLNYIEDVVTKSFDEYPRYPVETLFEQGGDCEDTSILAAAILSEMGYDVVLLLFEKIDHMGVGIHLTDGKGKGPSWIYDGKNYYYMDTSQNLRIGGIAAEYEEASAYVFPVGK
jgi:hypothetical protein